MRTRPTIAGMAMWAWLFATVAISCIPAGARAQPGKKFYTVKKGQMYIELNKAISTAELDSFINQFNLQEIGLKRFMVSKESDSIEAAGWKIQQGKDNLVTFTKPLESVAGANGKQSYLMLSIAERFPSIPKGLKFGYNKFKQGSGFTIRDSIVHFFLRNNVSAKRVMLAGSFNGFSPTATSMIKEADGWSYSLALAPGKYWYKFIVDGKWILDEDNLQKENDGEGNTNSVFFRPNVEFSLKGFQDAKRVNVAGSFNGWQPRELAMRRVENAWKLGIYLSEGTHTYRFVADGRWFADSSNPDRYPNEFNEFNSVIGLGRPYLFRLHGFGSARKVVLTGNFNNWRKDELFMKKTTEGWEIPYVIGEGNYEYRFVVDGEEIIDPSNPRVTSNDRRKANSILILGANYTFRLKGFNTAHTVIVAGDFNNFNETSYKMSRQGEEWVLPVHLSPGKHIYKFIVDGKWILDPANKLWEQNQFGTGNSIIWINPGTQ